MYNSLPAIYTVYAYSITEAIMKLIEAPFPFLRPNTSAPQMQTPLFAERIPAGFPSPAQGYEDATLDLNEYCIAKKHSTFFGWAEGDSMIEAGIHDGDLLIVDRDLRAKHGSIIIAKVDSEFTVKMLHTRPRLCLMPMNAAYSPIYPDPDTFEVWGVVTFWLHKAQK